MPLISTPAATSSLQLLLLLVLISCILFIYLFIFDVKGRRQDFVFKENTRGATSVVQG